MKIARVFPRRTRSTPDDELAFIGGPGLMPPEVDEVHISVAFTWDLQRADELVKEWEPVAPVKIGGPALNMRGEEFVPGMYLKRGNTITSRGCPLHCWFCRVPKVEGTLRELPIHDGWIVQDDNLLACSESHVRAVFAMLERQGRPAEFRGGLEPSMLEDWHVEMFAQMKPRPTLYFANDTPDDYEPLVVAGRKLREAGFGNQGHRLRCYVLIGWPKDTMQAAETRLLQTVEAGFTPFAMLWKNNKGESDSEWRKFQRRWARPAIIHAKRLTEKDPQGELFLWHLRLSPCPLRKPAPS